jgi:hypothetical protein
MTVTQAKTAVAERNRFALCVVVVEKEELVVEDVRANAWFVTDIGDKLENAVADFKVLSPELSETETACLSQIV